MISFYPFLLFLSYSSHFLFLPLPSHPTILSLFSHYIHCIHLVPTHIQWTKILTQQHTKYHISSYSHGLQSFLLTGFFVCLFCFYTLQRSIQVSICFHAKLENINNLPGNLLVEWVTHPTDIFILARWPIELHIGLETKKLLSARNGFNELFSQWILTIHLSSLSQIICEDWCNNALLSFLTGFVTFWNPYSFLRYIQTWISFISIGVSYFNSCFHLNAELSPSHSRLCPLKM